MLTDDLTPFFQPGEFAQAVTVCGFSVAAIYDAAYATDLDVLGTSPAVTLPTAACAGVVEGSTTVVVNAVNYVATRHMPDGTGVSVLRLRLA
jgi:hypothetical protein